jgi:hypothetical protein
VASGYFCVPLNDRIPTAVTTEAPFKMDIDTPPVPIVKNGTLQLKVRATRNEGYAEKITLRFLWNPPGISGPATIDLPGDQSEITYELNVAANATVGKHTTLFCRVLIPENGATILHQTGMGGTLRIDKPAPAPQVAANAPAAAQETPPAAAPSVAEKPLSHLEQLRQKAK